MKSAVMMTIRATDGNGDSWLARTVGRGTINKDGMGYPESTSKRARDMRFPRVRFTVLQIVIAAAVVAMGTVSLGQEKRTDPRGLPTAHSTKIDHAKIVPSKHQVTRRSDVIRFRIVDANTEKPVSLARIVIDDGILTPDLT